MAGRNNNHDMGNDIFSNVTNDDSADELDSREVDEGFDDEGNDELPDDLRDAHDRRDNDDDDNDDNDLIDQRQDEQRQQKPDQRQQRDQRQQKPAKPGKVDPFDPRVRLAEDRAGNLLGPDGQVIARKGRERTNFERWRKVAQADRSSAINMAQRMTKLAGQARQLFDTYTALKSQKDIYDQAGLSFDDKKMMLDLAVAYKANPLEGLKLMLTKAHMAGVDIKQITGVDAGFNPTVIIDAVKQHIDQKLKPVEDLTSQREDQSEIEAEAAAFFDRNPLARDVSEEMGNEKFAGMMMSAKRKFPHLSLDDIWQKIHYNIILRGTEQQGNGVTRPVTDRQQKPGQQRQPPRRQRQSQRVPAREESFDDIGQSVLRDLAAANSRSR